MIDGRNEQPVKTLNEQAESRWPHRLAVSLVCATFPLLWVGGLVTTYDAGMAVPDWPNTYGYNLFLYPWQSWVLGPWDVFIEHGHRLLGAAVGMLSIALVVVLWMRERRRWVRVLGVSVLLSVISQGVLGGLRVIENERLLAMVHGCFAPLVFSLTVAVAIVTSAQWKHPSDATLSMNAGKVHRLALFTTVLAYLQIVLGAQLRHHVADMSPSVFRAIVFGHLAVAAILFAHVLWLDISVARQHPRLVALNRPCRWLAGLLALQLVLGVATWVTNFGWPRFAADYAWTAGYVPIAEGPLQVNVTTAHVALGSLILVTALTVSLRSFRLLVPTDRDTSTRSAARKPMLMEMVA